VKRHAVTPGKDLPGAACGINRGLGGFRVQTAAYKSSEICYSCAAPNLFNRGAREIVMAKGQMRSNKEKKKPKADKNLKKGGAAPVNPFAAGKTPAGQSPNSKKS
jgi:hypothetical protein